LELHPKALFQLEDHAGDRILAWVPAGDRDARHGDDHRVGRWLGDVDVAAAGVREALPGRHHAPLAPAAIDRDGRRWRLCGGLSPGEGGQAHQTEPQGGPKDWTPHDLVFLLEITTAG